MLGWLNRIGDYARRYATVGLQDRLTIMTRRLDHQDAVADETRALAREARAMLAQAVDLVHHMNAQHQAFERRVSAQLLGQEDHEGMAFALLTQKLVELSQNNSAWFARLNGNMEKPFDQLNGVIGARLDELDIKVRPLVRYDAESWAIRLRDGYLMVPSHDPNFAIMVANASSNGLEPGVSLVIRRLLGPGMQAVDVGANVGLLTLVCAFTVGSAGRVWAFEPDPGPRKQLEKTIQFNGLKWVFLSSSALGAKAAQALFNVSSIIGHSSLHPLPSEEGAGAQLLDVNVTPLDTVIPEGTEIDLVKIDVEGAELEVIAGMTRILAESPDLALIVEYGPAHLRRAETTPDAWFEAFDDKGFRSFLIEEPCGRVTPVTAAALADIESANLLFLRMRSRPWVRLALE